SEINEPTYSAAIYIHDDPKLKLQQMEAQINDTSDRTKRFVYLPSAAKAALEAGDNTKAEAYAIEGLKLADAVAERHMRYHTPRPKAGTGKADYYCNFVLGRLAILRGDVRLAEKYSLLSGQTAGDAVLNSYGPNLSLALEILKKGDASSRQSILSFLDEIRSFWKITPQVIDEWVADIQAGTLPDFKQQLYY
ncbi:MAG: hypothetical protein M3Z09_00545, partial [Acidobacteriota bacterium]|nr:hypothetical protein [Acidobacteriota bacterium]